MVEENIRFKREILGVSFLLLLGSLFIVYPFLDALILAAATSYLLRFAHRNLDAKLENELLSSIIIISSVVGVIVLGLFFFINNFYDILYALNIFAQDLQENVNSVINVLNLPENFRAQTVGFIDSLSIGVENYLRGTLASIPSVMIDLGIYLVTSIYLFKDGKKINRKLFSVIDSLPENEQKITKTLIHSIDSIFKGVFLTQFTVAIIIGAITAAGFYIIGYFTTPIPFTLFWSLLVAIAALLPIVAGFMVYAPMGTYYLLFGEPVKGSLILVFGTIVVNILPEIFLRPYVGAKQLNEHPLIIFVGFIAGPLTLGLKGIVLGPLILILSKEFILNYSELVSSETG